MDASFWEIIFGGLVGAVFVYFVSGTIKRRNESGEAQKGSQQDWLIVLGLFAGIALLVFLLINMV
jgi:hypothetical protein